MIYAQLLPNLGNLGHGYISKLNNHNEIMLVTQNRPVQELKVEAIGKEEKMIVDLELGVKKEYFKKMTNPKKDLLKEEAQIVDLELAVKREEYKINRTKREVRVEL